MSKRKSRLEKKRYLDEVFFNIMATHLTFLALAMKDDSSIPAVRQYRKLIKSQLAGRRNPYFQVTRLEFYIKEALEISENI